MALLVEGLVVGPDTSVEEYIIGPASEYVGDHAPGEEERITLYGPEEGLSWVAQPVKGGQSALSLASRQGSLAGRGSMHLMDPLVTLFGSVHEKLPETMGSMRSALFPNFGSMFSVAGAADHQLPKTEQWDEESLPHEGEGEDGYASDTAGADYEENLQSPLLSRQATELEGKEGAPQSSVLSMRRNSSLMGGEAVNNMGIGGGWQLAWKWSEKEGGFKRIYLHQEGTQGSRRGSIVSLPGVEGAEGREFVHAAALVSQPALFSKDLIEKHPVGPAMVHPSEAAAKGSLWKSLLEPGVREALFVGVGIQILQQVRIILFCISLNLLVDLIVISFDFQLFFFSFHFDFVVSWHKWSSVLHTSDS
jgi:hypothetical protein